MRLLLVSANQERSPDPVAPLGVCYVAAAAAQAGHDVRVLDLCFSEDVEADVAAAVAAHRPEAIGISLRNVDNCAYPDTVSYLPHYRRVVDACRAASPAPLVLGGSAFTRDFAGFTEAAFFAQIIQHGFSFRKEDPRWPGGPPGRSANRR